MIAIEIDVDVLRQKLAFKVRFHLGRFCPDAEDLVQETLARFVNALNENAIHDRERIGAFVNGICNNVIREYRRRLWREPLFESSSYTEPTVEAEGEQQVLGRELRAAMRDLLPRDALVLRQFYIEQKSKQDICAALNLTDGQFRLILFRAKQRLRNLCSARRET